MMRFAARQEMRRLAPVGGARGEAVVGTDRHVELFLQLRFM
jgi:hypothetical protein